MSYPNSFIKEISEEIGKKEEMSYKEWLAKLPDNKDWARNSFQYIYDMINNYGTEEVIEQGEKRKRYKIFDHEFGSHEGENRLYGNSKFQQDLVNLLHGAANEREQQNRLAMVVGPPATGKSVAREILEDALKDYSQLDEGKVWTLRWNIEKVKNIYDKVPSLYRKSSPGKKEKSEKVWREGKCPMNDSPLKLIPSRKRKELLDELNKGFDKDYELNVKGELCPFCRENFKLLLEEYGSFEKILDSDLVRVERIQLSDDSGNGIGFLDPANVEHPTNLYGRVLPKNSPYSYLLDGELFKCNRGILFFEDAGQVIEKIGKSILDFIEEHKLKSSTLPRIYVDSFKMAISNLSIENKLEELEEKHAGLQGLTSRMRTLYMRYITEYPQEVELIKNVLRSEREEMTYEKLKESAELRGEDYFGSRVSEPVYLTSDKKQIELMPHSLEAAGLAAVISRIKGEGVKIDGKPIGKLKTALLYAKGEIDGKEYKWEQFKDSIDPKEGLDLNSLDFRFIIDQINSSIADSDGVVKPNDILERIVEKSKDEKSVDQFKKKYKKKIEEWIAERQDEEVRTSLIYHPDITKALDDYLHEVVYIWSDEEVRRRKDKFTGEEIGLDEDLLRSVEKRAGIAEDNADKFREKIVKECANAEEKLRDAGKAREVSWRDIKSLKKALVPKSWEDVEEDIDFDLLLNPQDERSEEQVERILKNLKNLFGYSEKSASYVLKGVAEKQR